MKKQFLNLGKTLNKAEQKEVNGGGGKLMCITDEDCAYTYVCNSSNFCEMPPNEQ